MILSKRNCFELEVSWWDCFKGVSLLSDLCLARNVDDLLDDVTGLVGFSLVPEWDESSDNVVNESFEDDEAEESDKISIYLYAVWTHSCSFAFSIADFEDCWS